MRLLLTTVICSEGTPSPAVCCVNYSITAVSYTPPPTPLPTSTPPELPFTTEYPELDQHPAMSVVIFI